MKFVLILKNKKNNQDVVSHPDTLRKVYSASRYAKEQHLQFKIRRYNPKKHDANMVND